MLLAEPLLERHTSAATAGLVDHLVAVYAKVYDSPPYQGDPFFSVGSFRARLVAALETPGFECVTASVGGTLVGLVHGATLPADRPWWESLGDRRPEDVHAAAQAGGVGWLRELMVLPEHAGRGVGRRLHDEWINGRAQRWTTLTCIPSNEPAHGAYLRWGYEIIGQIKHAPESPVYNAMILSSSTVRQAG
ncbi:GNAT family N-acetyltransferase [Kitasatospora sp. NPDC088548]|uniref:GNAT family N-acetyltransferase n=1 Tax=Kitasatospora sp. NPDC088548 TaxID=3364075 RepID=UPI0037FD68BC